SNEIIAARLSCRSLENWPFCSRADQDDLCVSAAFMLNKVFDRLNQQPKPVLALHDTHKQDHVPFSSRQFRLFLSTTDFREISTSLHHQNAFRLHAPAFNGNLPVRLVCS